MVEAVLIVAVIIMTGITGYRVKSLTTSGALAAFLVGLAVYAGFGAKGLFLLGFFFATSSFWSNYKSAAKRNLEEKLAKGATRDWRQVFANGGQAAVFSILYFFYQDSFLLLGFLVSLASANSDTWASEIGSLSKRDPIYIRTFRRVDRGTSGAVSLLGSSAALLGALTISVVGYFLFKLDLLAGALVFFFGYVGNVIDTLFGAFYQQVYVCRECNIETEKKVHCGQPTRQIKGIMLMDNDMVNFLSGLVAAILAIGVFRVFY
jgi:uncharacterized protein (TIGR00297 family)